MRSPVACLLLLAACGRTETRALSDERPPLSRPGEGPVRLDRPGVAARPIVLPDRGARGVAVDPDTGFVYVALGGGTACDVTLGSPAVLAIAAPDADRAMSVPTARAPDALVADPDGGAVFVTSRDEGAIAGHVLGSGLPLDPIRVGGRPSGIALAPRARKLLVSNTREWTDEFIALVSAERPEVNLHRRVRGGPRHAIVDESTSTGYVAHLGGAVSVVDVSAGLVLRTLESGIEETGGAVLWDEGRRLLIASREGEAVIAVLDTSTGEVLASIPTFGPEGPAFAIHLAIDGARRLLYATLERTSLVGVVDLDTLATVAFVEVAGCPFGLALDAARDLGYAGSFTTPELTRFDLALVAWAVGRR